MGIMEKRKRCKFLRCISIRFLISATLLLGSCGEGSDQSSNSDSQISPNWVHSPKHRSLQFGPEFEFSKTNHFQEAAPLRSVVFSRAIHQFAHHLGINQASNFPKVWLESDVAMTNQAFKNAIEFKGELPFVTLPDTWPNDIESVYIDTAGLNGTHAELISNPPNIQFFTDAGDILRLSYGADDVFMEAHINPLTIDQSTHYAPMIDDLIFDLQSSTPIVVPQNGGGHIHIDLSRLIQYPDPNDLNAGLLLLRNFFVDFYANSEFITYGLRADPTWALPLGMTSKGQHDLFMRRIQKIDSIIANRSFESIEEAVEFVTTEFRRLNLLIPITAIQTGDFSGLKFRPSIDIAKPALRIAKDLKTLEIRALHAQQSYQEYIDFTKLFRGRIRYLSRLDKPLPLPSWSEIEINPSEFNTQRLRLETINKLARQTHRYISEATSVLTIEESHSLSKRIFPYLQRSFSRFSCSN